MLDIFIITVPFHVELLAGDIGVEHRVSCLLVEVEEHIVPGVHVLSVCAQGPVA